MKHWARWGMAITGAAALVGVIALRPARSLPRASAATPAFEVPRVDAHVTLDGALAEPSWIHLAARTGGFFDDGGQKAIPFSEARVMWQGERLLLALYAADIDIETTPETGVATGKEDVFEIAFRRGERVYALALSAGGERVATECAADGWACTEEPRPWASGVEVGLDVDGTPNTPADDDEEWVLEVAIPLRALGIEPRAGAEIDMRLRRCDFPRGAARACATWSAGRRGTITLKG